MFVSLEMRNKRVFSSFDCLNMEPSKYFQEVHIGWSCVVSEFTCNFGLSHYLFVLSIIVSSIVTAILKGGTPETLVIVPWLAYRIAMYTYLPSIIIFQYTLDRFICYITNNIYIAHTCSFLEATITYYITSSVHSLKLVKLSAKGDI